MFEGPKWVDCFTRDYWRKRYVQELLACTETANLPRFGAHSQPDEGLDHLAAMFGVTGEQIATVRLKELGETLAAGMLEAPSQDFRRRAKSSPPW